MRAAAIVVTHNSAPHIAGCLRELFSAGLEVWVVDNASTDRTVEIVSSRFGETHLIVNAANRGFAAAVNQALASVDAEAILLVNPDSVMTPKATKALLTYLADNPDTGVVGPRIRDPHGRIVVSAHPFETATTVLASRFGGNLLPVAARRLLSLRARRDAYDACVAGTAPTPVDWVSGACLAVRGDLLRAIGGLDEAYFMYYEDEELCLQAARAGAAVVYLPSAEVRHIGGASSSDPLWIWPHLYRSLLRFQARHHPRTFVLVRAALALRAAIGVALGVMRAVLGRREGARRARAWAQVARLTIRQVPTIVESVL